MTFQDKPDEALMETGPEAADNPRVGHRADHAVGVRGALHGLAFGTEGRGLLSLLTLNRTKLGVKCPGCAWPNADPGHGGLVDFCENGAKAVAEETTHRRCNPDFFARHTIAALRHQPDYWLGRQGRLTHPMIYREGDTHYKPISWKDALEIIANYLQNLDNPNDAIFYTSGRTANESAFMYQVFARQLGTNNLPDCSNMCHEATGKALIPTIGIGKGTVTLQDLAEADLIITLGQNPGTNHPRQLIAFEEQKKRGGKIIALNPLPEAGLMNFRNPQTVRGVVGGGTPIADEFYQIRLDGDMAFFQALNKELIDRDALDHNFLDKYCAGQEEVIEHLRATDPEKVRAATGLKDEDIKHVADLVQNAKRGVIVCWALGATQHKNSVATLQEIINFLLLTGNMGKPGAGACPVRGHSNVQGDRTMGVWEAPPEWLSAAIEKEFGFSAPREHGYNVVQAARAIRDRGAKFFMQMGGNFIRAASDTAVLEDAMGDLEMTVHVSTKLNRSHLYPGKTSLILPVLARTDADIYQGEYQSVTTEDSMGTVTPSTGKRRVHRGLYSETKITGELGYRIFGNEYWLDMGASTKEVRKRIERVIPGFGGYEVGIRSGKGLVLPNGPRIRRFDTPTGRANLTVNQLDVLECPPGHLVLQSIRSHDQYNTTIYALSDRYRGVHYGRRVVMINRDDLAELGFKSGDLVDLVSNYEDGERRAPNFRVVEYDTPKQCAAAYMPEVNVLIPLDNYADVSQTPIMKAIMVRLEKAEDPDNKAFPYPSPLKQNEGEKAEIFNAQRMPIVVG
ncbi:MAG: FdhF/YdeP family oxidoreductase [Actinomycetaceae bacterium]|nr:FdhF/YdeP family oxidoreductase [Actinomycetaceae bacterium]